MRLALALAALVVAAGPAAAGCVPRSIGESPQGYADELLRRMRPLGISDINFGGHAGASNHYLVSGAEFSLFIEPDGPLMREIGFVLSEPASTSEIEKLMTAASFTLSKLSGTAESGIKDQLYNDFAKHSSGSWAENFGSAAAAFTRTDKGTVIKTGLLTCS